MQHHSQFQTPLIPPPPSSTTFHYYLLFSPHLLHLKPLATSSSLSITHSKKSTDTSVPNLKPLTSRVVQLTRRRQLHQIFEEVELAKKRHGKLNTIVMNAVLHACVHCNDIQSALKIFREMAKPESCGVDNVSYGIILKGLGEARMIDEAFQILESLEQGLASGCPKLSSELICGLLDALIKAGDLRRANGLLARFSYLLHEGGRPCIWVYNLLMKGHINTGEPHAALDLYDEILREGLDPDKLTYNTLIFGCIKAERLDAAVRFYEEMKDKAENMADDSLLPDSVTYTTLLKGFSNTKDLVSITKLILEMKSCNKLLLDRVAYTAVVDALIACGSIKGALCVFGEIIKQSGRNPDLIPKPHLYLSLMRAFAVRGDYYMVKHLHYRMWPESRGVISSNVQKETDHLLMEAALNQGQLFTRVFLADVFEGTLYGKHFKEQVVLCEGPLSVQNMDFVELAFDLALASVRDIMEKWKEISWTSRGGVAVLRIEALLGFSTSLFSPRLLPEVSASDPIEHFMTPFDDAQPLQANVRLEEVVMRLYRDPVVPIIDTWGSCVGILHREDCNKLYEPLSDMMRSPPPWVTMSTSIGRVIDLMLAKKYKMIIIAKHGDLPGMFYSSSIRAVGVFTFEKLCKLTIPSSRETDVHLTMCAKSI